MSREYLVMKLNRLALATGLAFLFSLNIAFAADKPIKLVVFGDSLVAGYGLAPGQAFPEKLQNALTERGLKVEVNNAGVSGDTTSAGLARLDWSTPPDTNAVILELGANDALRGISTELTKKNLDAMITRLKERNISILIAGMLAPPNMGEDYANGFNPIYKSLSDKHQIALYPFFLDGVAGIPELNQSDSIHPTAEGINIIVEKILPTIEDWLADLN